MTNGTPPQLPVPDEPGKRRRAGRLPLLIIALVAAMLAAIGCLAGLIVVVQKDRRPPPPPPMISPSPRPSEGPTTPGGGPSGTDTDGPPGNALFRW
ncbi:MAG: hypothetical protein HOV71_28940 [Hamadaea sp.]|nr:hypothetical protein [Hamadaea sp.]